MWIQSLAWGDPLEKGMATTPVFLSGEAHGQRSLAGCGPWGHKELDTTEVMFINYEMSQLFTYILISFRRTSLTAISCIWFI